MVQAQARLWYEIYSNNNNNAGDSNNSKNNCALPAALITPSDSYLN